MRRLASLASGLDPQADCDELDFLARCVGDLSNRAIACLRYLLHDTPRYGVPEVATATGLDADAARAACHELHRYGFVESDELQSLYRHVLRLVNQGLTKRKVLPDHARFSITPLGTRLAEFLGDEMDDHD